MAISTVKICNAALSLIKVKQITNATLSSGTEAERQCSLMFPILRDKLLHAHPWNFAEKRQALAALTETPPFEYTYYYQLPADCLRVLRLYDEDASYRIEAENRLATDASPCNLIYISAVTDVAQFDPGFTQALIYNLASHLAVVMSANRTLAAELRQRAREELSLAKSQDAQEGYPLQRRTKGGWLSARRSRSGISGRWNT